MDFNPPGNIDSWRSGVDFGPYRGNSAGGKLVDCRF